MPNTVKLVVVVVASVEVPDTLFVPATTRLPLRAVLPTTFRVLTVVVANVVVPSTDNNPVFVVEANTLFPDVKLEIVVVARVLVPVTVNKLEIVDVPKLVVVAVMFVATKLVPVALSNNKLEIKACNSESKPLIDKLPQIVEVPVVDELPATKLPKSFTLNVDEPTPLVIDNASVADVVEERSADDLTDSFFIPSLVVK